jgi:hypothetical protein
LLTDSVKRGVTIYTCTDTVPLIDNLINERQCPVSCVCSAYKSIFGVQMYMYLDEHSLHILEIWWRKYWWLKSSSTNSCCFTVSLCLMN